MNFDSAAHAADTQTAIAYSAVKVAYLVGLLADAPVPDDVQSLTWEALGMIQEIKAYPGAPEMSGVEKVMERLGGGEA